jgi:hypothetical protein
MIPFERQIYVDLLKDFIKDENDRIEAENLKRKG